MSAGLQAPVGTGDGKEKECQCYVMGVIKLGLEKPAMGLNLQKALCICLHKHSFAPLCIIDSILPHNEEHSRQ